MPPIDHFKCDVCDWIITTGWGGFYYYSSLDGKRIVLRHPLEYSSLVEYYNEDRGRKTGKTYDTLAGYSFKQTGKPEELEECTGFNSYSVCLDCLKISQLRARK